MSVINTSNPTTHSNDASLDGAKIASCTVADAAAGKCSVEASDTARQHATAEHTAGSESTKDLPKVRIGHSTTTASGVEPLAGKIGKEMTVTELITNGVLAGPDTPAAQGDQTAARDRAKDKVTSLAVAPAEAGKPSTGADFYVSATGVVTANHNLDSNKNAAVRIEFEPNPAAQKSEDQMTAEEREHVRAQRTAINALCEYLKEGYGDPANFKITDEQNLIADYLKTQTTVASQDGSLDQGGSQAPFGGRMPQGGGGYRGMDGQPGMHGGAGSGGADGSSNPFRGMGNPYSGMGNGGDGFGLPPSGPAFNPFELTGLSVLGWLAELGIDLGDPPDPERLEAAIKRLEKQNPELAKALKSNEFKQLIKEWHDTGHAPTAEQLAKALPEGIRTEITQDLKQRYEAHFKDPQTGAVDQGKVAVSIHVGHYATAEEMEKYKDIAEAASRHEYGDVVPVEERRAVIEQGLRLAGAAVNETNIACMNQIVTRESGWHANIVNTWDINAQRGDPSVGVAQVIGATFQKFAAPGCGDIRDPRHNIAAALRYMGHQYGGGDINQGLWVVANRSGGY